MLEIQDCSEALLLLCAYSVILTCISKLISSRTKTLYLSIAVIVVGVAIRSKHYYESKDENLYRILDIARGSTTVEIRQAFRVLSKSTHPDKSNAPNAEADFVILKFAYDVLMDESKREIYNKFGLAKLDFDPRGDEVRLFGKLMFSYVFWAACGYVLTLGRGAGSARVWVAIVGTAMLVAEAVLLFSSAPPPLVPPPSLCSWSWCRALIRVTESELIAVAHACALPAIMALLKVVGEYCFVDVDRATATALVQLSTGFQAMDQILKELQLMNRAVNCTQLKCQIGGGGEKDQETARCSSDGAIVTTRANSVEVDQQCTDNGSGSSSSSSSSGGAGGGSGDTSIDEGFMQAQYQQFAASERNIEKLQAILQQSNMQMQAIVHHLSKSSSTLGDSYFWVIFVLMYGAIFLIQ